MARRINVTGVTDTDTDGYGEELYGVVGWFDLDKVTTYLEDTFYDGSNHISKATGSQYDHQELMLTAGGRWVLHNWSQWQGSESTYRFTTDEKAREWLIAQKADEAVAKHFGPLEDESGPGRPGIGKPVLIRLGDDLVASLDQWATSNGVSRAEAARRLLAKALA